MRTLYLFVFEIFFCDFGYYSDCVSRQFVKIMVSRSRNFLHWLMEKPYGAYLIIIFARIFIVLVLWRCYIYSFPLFQIIYNYRSVSICFILIIWSQDPQKAGGRESIMSAIDYPDAVHNFIFSQKLTTLLGNFPEVTFSQLFQYKRPINFYMFPRQYEVCSILPQVLCNGTPNKSKNENNSTSTCTNNT